MWYSLHDLALICNTSVDVVTEAAVVSGKRVMAGQLTFTKPIPASFIEEINRIDAMRRRAEQRKAGRT